MTRISDTTQYDNTPMQYTAIFKAVKKNKRYNFQIKYVVVFFLIFCSKQKLRVHVRTSLVRNKKNITMFRQKIVNFEAVKITVYCIGVLSQCLPEPQTSNTARHPPATKIWLP